MTMKHDPFRPHRIPCQFFNPFGALVDLHL
jgi:hypothetical protein